MIFAQCIDELYFINVVHRKSLANEAFANAIPGWNLLLTRKTASFKVFMPMKRTIYTY